MNNKYFEYEFPVSLILLIDATENRKISTFSCQETKNQRKSVYSLSQEVDFSSSFLLKGELQTKQPILKAY